MAKHINRVTWVSFLKKCSYIMQIFHNDLGIIRIEIAQIGYVSYTAAMSSMVMNSNHITVCGKELHEVSVSFFMFCHAAYGGGQRQLVRR